MADITTIPGVRLVESGAVKVTTSLLEDMKMTVRELSPIGIATVYEVPIPSTASFKEWSFFQQIAMLKAGAWNKIPVAQVIYAIAYANRLNLDIMQGDVYSTGDGRIATSNKAKIKMALATGRIEGIEVNTLETDEEINLPGCIATHDMVCTVTITVKGWQKSIIKSQRLTEWFMGNNPNWKNRPSHMLELNTTAHACELVSPTETGPDEYPSTLVEATPSDDLTAALKASVEATAKI